MKERERERERRNKRNERQNMRDRKERIMFLCKGADKGWGWNCV